MSELAATYYISSGHLDKAIDFYTSRKQLSQALLVAKVEEQGGYRSITNPMIDYFQPEEEEKKEQQNETKVAEGKSVEEDRVLGPMHKLVERDREGKMPSVPSPKDKRKQNMKRSRLTLITSLMGEQYYKSGEPVRSACCHMAIGDYKKAIEVSTRHSL